MRVKRSVQVNNIDFGWESIKLIIPTRKTVKACYKIWKKV